MQQYENTIEIQNYLPHRAPMLLVDLILELNHHEAKTIFEIKEDNLFIENGFFAEVGLIENAAQTCSSIVGQSFFSEQNSEKNINVIGFISGIKKLKVHQLAKTGDIIHTNATLSSRFDTSDYCICTMACTTFHEGVLLFEAEINLFIQEEK